MTGDEIFRGVGADGDDDDVRRLFAEMAWSRTRVAAGLRPDQSPYSLYGSTVDAELWGEQVRQLRRLRQLFDAELRSARYQHQQMRGGGR